MNNKMIRMKQTFEIEGGKLQITTTLIASLLRDYFRKLMGESEVNIYVTEKKKEES